MRCYHWRSFGDAARSSCRAVAGWDESKRRGGSYHAQKPAGGDVMTNGDAVHGRGAGFSNGSKGESGEKRGGTL
ncbi:hypothetical protein VFPBJ_07699 [Purpureocillium lilacinum]|uniref:Uncharacterized protein n=1 Tax=Purpureocillium lilacinum TaxID=33203 RepID=A0A179GH82_PURLI|nr:hypothetical protein VFPBJ_07699 [Purpureocillium lilacinum]